MIKKFIILFLACSVIYMVTSSVSAENISYKKINGVYYNQVVNGNLKSNYVTMFYFGPALAYCIEPGVDINTSDYNSSKDWSQTSFTKQQQEQFEKIGYYGYEYPGHQKPEYYLAAQELIWEVSNPNIEVYWSTGKNGSGNRLNYDKEKQEILDLIEKDSIRPSFSETKITGEIGKEVIINDENNVLKDYTISESNYHKLELTENQLKINFNKEVKPSETITLTRNNYDSGTLIVYTKNNSQKLATLRFSTPIQTSFELENYEVPSPPEETPKEETPEVVKVPSTGINTSNVMALGLVASAFVFRIKKIL